MNKYRTNCFEIVVNDVSFYNFKMPVKDIVEIFYVAVRGKDTESGSVQRVLNKSRIKDIKQFILKDNMFLNSFILNWTDVKNIPTIKDDVIEFPIRGSVAQVIDGQHRLEGLKEALKEDETIGEKYVVVSMGLNLKTEEAAYFFLNINSEQKPVPKSLIFDLYGIGYKDKGEFAIQRATEIAKDINSDENSPYYGQIKFPGTPRGKGTIDLATVVNVLKKWLDPEKGFGKINLTSIELQKQALLNFYNVLFDVYGSSWDLKTKNPFMKNTGFYAATDFFCDKILEKCAEKRSFKKETISEILKLDKTNLLFQNDITKLDGKTARVKIKQ